MRIKFMALGVVILIAGACFVASTLQLEEMILSARYEMLACEGCNHMTVEKSKDRSLIGKTIIPVSSVIDIEQMIDSISLMNEPLCVRGKPYRFNWNLWGINPGGVRFDVTAKESLSFCDGL